MGRQLLASCTTALVCLLLACVGPLCVVLFVPAYKVRRGAWNENHCTFSGLLVQHLAALTFIEFVLYCVG